MLTPGRCTVAGTVFRASPHRTIDIRVPQIPRRPRNDQTTTPSAGDISRGDSRFPQPPQTLVIRPVTPRNSLLRRHQSSTLKKGGETRDSAGVAVRFVRRRPPARVSAAARVHPATRGSARYGGVTHGCRISASSFAHWPLEERAGGRRGRRHIRGAPTRRAYVRSRRRCAST
jgi:hypothetical protein